MSRGRPWTGVRATRLSRATPSGRSSTRQPPTSRTSRRSTWSIDHVDLLEVLDVGGCLVEERPEGVARESLVARTPVYGFLRNLVLDDKAVLRGASGPFACPDDQGSRTRYHALPPPDRGLDQARRRQVFVYGADVLHPEAFQRHLANR